MYFYVKDDTFRHAPIKISPLEFSGTEHHSGAVLMARLCFITDQIAQNIDLSFVCFPKERYICRHINDFNEPKYIIQQGVIGGHFRK